MSYLIPQTLRLVTFLQCFVSRRIRVFSPIRIQTLETWIPTKTDPKHSISGYPNVIESFWSVRFWSRSWPGALSWHHPRHPGWSCPAPRWSASPPHSGSPWWVADIYRNKNMNNNFYSLIQALKKRNWTWQILLLHSLKYLIYVYEGKSKGPGNGIRWTFFWSGGGTRGLFSTKFYPPMSKAKTDWIGSESLLYTALTSCKCGDI